MLVDRDPLASAARSRPQNLAIIDRQGGNHLTFDELDETVDRIAANLGTSGIDSGATIVLLGYHGAETVATIHAAWRIGATIAPLDPGLSDDRRQSRIERIDPAVVISTSAVSSTTDVPVADLSVETDSAAVPAGHDPDDLACLLFTSGTTGTARAVRLTARNLVTSACASASRLGTEPTDRWVVPLAPYHMGGFAPVIRCALAGTTIVPTSSDRDAIERAIRTDDATIASIVPTLLRRGLENETPYDELRILLVGGDRTPPRLVERALAADVPLYVSYGMTETTSQAATATPTMLDGDSETVGRPLRWTNIEIDGQTVQDDTGEILIRGPTVSPGYFGTDVEARFGTSGTFRTGDRGYLDAGRLYVVGRVDDRIVSGGVTIDPTVVEDAIRSHAVVRDVTVVGIPDPEWGERVCALIVPRCTETPDLEDFLRTRLRSAERPREIHWVSVLPRTPSGTVDRAAARSKLQEQASNAGGA